MLNSRNSGDAVDVNNQPLSKGFYFNSNARTITFFTGKYNSSGNPIFELLRNGALMDQERPLVRKWYTPIADPKHFIDSIVEQRPYVEDKLREEETTQQEAMRKAALGSRYKPASPIRSDDIADAALECLAEQRGKSPDHYSS